MATPDDDRLRRIRLLTEVSLDLTAATTMERVLTLLVERAARLLDAERAVLLLSEDDEFVVKASHRIDASLLRIDEGADHAAIEQRLAALLGVEDTRGVLSVPLVARDAVRGVLAVSRPAEAPGFDEDEWLLSALADQGSVALDTEVQSQKLTREKLARAEAEALAERIRVSERDYRFLTESIPQIVWTATGDGAVNFANQHWAAYTGFTDAETFGSGFLNAVHPDDREATEILWARSVREGVPVDLQHRFRRRDGVYHWFLVRAYPQRDAEGRVEKWFGTCTDIHEQKQVEVENARLAAEAEREGKRAEEANRAKDLFLTTLSHELRTPLNAIMGWTRLLRSGRLPVDEQARALETVERNAKSQAQLIDDILDVSRIVSGKMRLDPKPIDIAELVTTSVESVRPTAEAKGLTVTTHIASDAGFVVGDLARLQQIVWNLLSNAIKFTAARGTVTVRLRRSEKTVTVMVRDTGVGINAAFLPHVFERFWQADPSTTRTHGGLGLGLAIVRHLVELHGGSIRADSDGEGKGAVFTMELPAMVSHAMADARASDPPRRPSSEQQEVSLPRLDGVRVLVVDDEIDAREMVASLLNHCRAEAMTAESAAEAMAILEGHPIDLLVSDIGMPDEDGYGLIRRVRAHERASLREVPAVALTAYARREDKEKAKAAGFHAHLAKPVDLVALVSVAAELTRARRQS